MSRARPIVFLVPMGLLLGAAVWSMVNLEAFFAAASAANTWILKTFGYAFALAVLSFVLTCAWVFVSPLAHVRIGGPDAKPILSTWNWFSITLCTTIAIGILFWAMAEPMFHVYDAGTRDLGEDPGAPRQFALVSLFMHWTISPYAIYTVPSLVFALSFHNFKTANSVSGPLQLLAGRRFPARLSEGLDALVLISLILGMAASLGAGMLLLAGGIGSLAKVSTTPALLALIAIAIVVLVLISSLTGLLKGIRILSDINTKFFFAFVAFVFVFGPSGEILMGALRALWGYGVEFAPRSLMVGIGGDRDWANAWTIFYWANWLAWAPVTAMFLGRIAVGYTVRTFILVNLVLPAVFSMVWMSVLGGFAISTDAELGGGLKQVLDADGPEAVAFEAITVLPLSGILIVALLALSFVSYVTAADSNTEAIRMICEGEADDTVGAIQAGRTGAVTKIMWMILLGGTAWLMTAFSGLDGIRMLSNLGGLPALFIVSALNILLLKWTMATRSPELNGARSRTFAGRGIGDVGE
ncbi:MAG: BCCT family transporter [Pseudomonadota bacterium]